MAAAIGTEPAVVIKMGTAQRREDRTDLPVVVTDPKDANRENGFMTSSIGPFSPHGICAMRLMMRAS
jgi:hypothetical protein